MRSSNGCEQFFDHNLVGILDLLMFCETKVGDQNICLGAAVVLLSLFVSKIDLTLDITLDRSRER